MIAAIFLTAVPALTAQEAQTLPVREIAQRVLGAAGALVIDVERPRWPSCVGLCPPQRSTPEGPPSVKTLTLYTRASATTEAGWLGLCRATAIDVRFDENGAITGLQQSTTVGWLGELTRERTGSATAGASASSIQYAEFEARCGALATTRSFVRAFGALDGERALIAVALIHNSMATGGPIRVTCTIDLIGRQPCGTASDLRALADDVTVAKISGDRTSRSAHWAFRYWRAYGPRLLRHQLSATVWLGGSDPSLRAGGEHAHHHPSRIYTSPRGLLIEQTSGITTITAGSG